MTRMIRPRCAPGRRPGGLLAAGLVLAAPLLLTGCAGPDPDDVTACERFEEIQAGVEPYLREGLPTPAEAAELPRAERDLLSQWTFDLADLAKFATDTDLRALLRRAADEAHTAYAGVEASEATYTGLVDDVRDRCAQVGTD